MVNDVKYVLLLWMAIEIVGWKEDGRGWLDLEADTIPRKQEKRERVLEHDPSVHGLRK